MRRTRERFRGLRLEVPSVEVFVPPSSLFFLPGLVNVLGVMRQVPHFRRGCVTELILLGIEMVVR